MSNAEFRMQTVHAWSRRPWVMSAFCILLSAFVAAGCAKAQAKAAPAGPPLSVPAPPPRVLAPVDSEPLAENPPTPEPTPTPPPPRTNARPATPTTRRPPTTTTETEPKTEPAPAPAPPAAAAETPATPPRPAAAAVADPAAEKRIRDVLKEATSRLNRVDFKKLSADGKAQYDQSKRFNEQAEQLLKDRDYVFAATIANKAAALATELLGR